MATRVDTAMSVILSSFLSLPGEVRTSIYELLLLSPHDPQGSRGQKQFVYPYVERSNEEDHELSFATGLHSAILASCKTVFSEASAILYAGNSFGLWMSHVSPFAYMIGPRNVNLLRDVSVYINGVCEVPNHFRWDQVFRHASGLRRLQIGFECVTGNDTWGNDGRDQYSQSIFLFFKRAQVWLKHHPSLTLGMSPHGAGQHFTSAIHIALDVSFVATEEDYRSRYLGEEKACVLDLNTILNELRDSMQMPMRQRKRADRRNRS